MVDFKVEQLQSYLIEQLQNFLPYIFWCIPVIGIYIIYTRLITKRNKALEAFSGIEIQLIKRYDIIPNMLKIASKFLEHEKTLLTEITELRTQAVKGIDKNNPDEIAKFIHNDNVLQGKLSQLMMNIENYPELKSDTTIQHAMVTLNEIEEHISAARRFYNSAVTDLNNSVQIFPSSIIAAMLKIKSMTLFEAPQHTKTSIDVSDYLK